MLTRTFRIGKLAGIEIAAHWSIILLLGFVFLGRNPLSITKLFATFWVLSLFLICIIAHELGHALVARPYGIPTQRIVLWPLGGFAIFQHPPPTPWSDLVISAAGPLVNLALAGFAFMLRLILDLAFGPGWADITSLPFAPWDLAFTIRFFSIFNLILALTNLLPIYPLDGGHILRDVFEMLIGRQKADKFMFVISVPLAVAAGLIGVFILEDISTGPIALLIVLGACLLDPRLNRYISAGWTALFNRGDYYLYHRHDYPKAIAAYDAMVRRHPNNVRAYHNRAAVYATIGKHELALADFNQILQRDPHNFKAYFDRGNSYRALRKYSQAIADYDKVIAINPIYAHAYHNRGATHAYAEQYEQAIADYNHVLAIHPQSAKAHADRAWARFLRGDAEASVNAEFDQAVALQPNDAGVLLMRGHVAWLKRAYNAASVDFERAAELAPTLPEALYNGGFARLLRGEHATALVLFKELTQRMPASALGHIGSGLVYHQCSNFPSAIAAFDAAVILDSGDITIYLYRSLSRFAYQDIEGATADLHLAVERDPEKALLHDEPFLEKFFIGQMDWAHSILTPLTLKQDGVPSLAYISRGDIARWNGLHEQAIEDYTQAILRARFGAEAYMGRARALLAQNQHRAAHSDLVQVVALKKGSRMGREASDLLSEYVAAAMEGAVKE